MAEIKRVIYADNAATTQLDADAFEAMRPFLLDEYGNPSQPYSFSRSTRNALASARSMIASCIGAHENEIFFTSGGTESDNWAIKCGSRSGDIITSAIEHHAVLKSCEKCSAQSHVTYILPDMDGFITPESVEASITEKTKLVSIMTANNEIGTIQPISQISHVCKKHGVLFHTDAVQAVGHIPLTVGELGVDLFSASAHKFHGPRGIGFLYLKNGTIIDPYLDGGSQEYGHRAGTQNIPAIVGMAFALQKACANMNKNIAYVTALEQMLLNGLRERGVPFFRNGGTHSLPGLLSLSFRGFDGEAIMHRMDLMGIAVSTGSACNGHSTAISHVLKGLQLDEEHARGTIRISLGDYNTENDINEIVDALCRIVSV